ncbi:MAG: wax ester/triacylglycerol synthase family O-acyltransferase [Oleiphilaceae bacterium]|nr:wax ester/triacylglycerol synthase family O-acyltransferase [Oleiphilaceae bacterium]
MQSLSELDSSFLLLESERSPLHVGGVFVFKKSNSRSRFNFNRFRDILATKLGNEPFFRERLVEAPLNLDMPAWSDDPDFDLDNHLSHVSLRDQTAPCTLLELASEIFSTPLDRSKPLWSATYIDGLEQHKGYTKLHFALVLKVHITAIDGATGEDILSQLLHVSPEISEISDPEPWTPAPLPDSNTWLGNAYNNALNIPLRLAHLAKDTAAGAFHNLLFDQLQKLNLPASLMSVAPTPINQRISSKRVIDNIEIPAEQIRQIRKQLHDVTTNDILMGICAEALAHYLKDNGTTTSAPLVALAPISVRSTSLDVKSGNQITATLFSLATTESHPIKRIRLIHEAASNENLYDSAISANRLTELVPSCVAAISARVYSEFMLAQKFKPMFNLPITNIPGPQFPLYFEDNELCQYICASPLFDGIGLAMMIVSYNGVFSLTTTYCPDLEVQHEKPFTHYIQAALDNILSTMNEQEPEIAAEPETARNGIIEDVVGLVNNLLTFGQKESKTTENSGSETS